MFAVIFTAKDFIVCFSVFASFASFAVHDFYLDCSLSFSPRKILLSVSLCSRCSRFMILKGSVHNKSNREMRKTCESLYGLLLLVRTVRVVRVVRGSCFLSRLFVVIFTAKDFMACFSLFVPFASFAVQASKTECLLSF